MKIEIPIGAELLYKGSIYDVKKGDGACTNCAFYDAANGCLNKELSCTCPEHIFVKKPDYIKKVYGADTKTTETVLLIMGIIVGFVVSIILYNVIW